MNDERLEAAARALYESLVLVLDGSPWDRMGPIGRRPWIEHAANVLAAADAHDTFEYGVRDRFGNTAGLRARGTWESFAEADDVRQLCDRTTAGNYVVQRRAAGPWERVTERPN